MTRDRMTGGILGAALGAAALLLPGAALAAETIVVGGTGTALGMAAQLGEAFEAANPGVAVKILPSLGSTGGIKALTKGTIDVALVSRPLTAEEDALGHVDFALTRTPMAVVVREDNAVTDITTEMLRSILDGSITTWPDGRRIRPVLRARGESDAMIVKAISPAMSDAYDAALGRPEMLLAMTDQECLQMVASTPGSIGFSTLIQLQTEGGSVRTVPFGGRLPSVEALRDGTYPLEKTISVLSRWSPTDATHRFVEFLRSPEADRIIGSHGGLVIPRDAAR